MNDTTGLSMILMSAIILVLAVVAITKRVCRTESRYEEPEFKPLVDKWEPEN